VADNDERTSPPVDATLGADTVAVETVRALARLSRLLERASSELSLANYRVLAAIGSGDERASRVGRKLALGKPTVSATVESLCQRGLVSRGSVGGDQRAVALTLTDLGRDTLERVERAMVERVGGLCDLAPDPVALRQALSWLGPALDELLADGSSTDAADRTPTSVSEPSSTSGAPAR
jgi:DNA-binding MarR family transcriptional regulator